LEMYLKLCCSVRGFVNNIKFEPFTLIYFGLWPRAGQHPHPRFLFWALNPSSHRHAIRFLFHCLRLSSMLWAALVFTGDRAFPPPGRCAVMIRSCLCLLYTVVLCASISVSLSSAQSRPTTLKSELSAPRRIKASASNGPEQVLYAFQGLTDGEDPTGGLILDNAGNLYGTTTYGGTGCITNGISLCGTVFKLSPNANGSWSETVIYSFRGGTDGESYRRVNLRCIRQPIRHYHRGRRYDLCYLRSWDNAGLWNCI
jgi:hypothetical protein